MAARKKILRTTDRLLGNPTRSVMRNLIAQPLLESLYDVTIEGIDVALSCTEGALIISNHVSFVDPPLLLSLAWPYAHVRPTPWYKQYYNPVQWPFMVVSHAIPLGSAKTAPFYWGPGISGQERADAWERHREAKRKDAMEIMCKVLSDPGPGRPPRFLLIFAEGGIGDGKTVVVNRRLRGVHDLLKVFPKKPVLMVTIKGLEHSRFGRHPEKGPLFKKLPVVVRVERFDNVSLDGGYEAFNGRIADYYNHGTPLEIAKLAA